MRVYNSDLLLCGDAVEETFPIISVDDLPTACKDSSNLTWQVTEMVHAFQQKLLYGNFETSYLAACL